MEYLQSAERAARDAGKYILSNIGKVRQVSFKSIQSNLVTEVDKKSEEIIIKTLQSDFPDFDILAEESGASSTKNSEFMWVIDPLDGTTNFAHGLPIFSISIGLIKGNEVIVGVIYDPTRDQLFTAEKGKGAFLNGQKLSVSKTKDIKKALLVTGFPYNVEENPDHCFERFVIMTKHSRAVRRLGSAALDFAYVAAGIFDGFWEVKLNPWDIAAGLLLVKEAGGKVTNFKGEESDIFNPQILASNGYIHKIMIELLEKAEQTDFIL
jgi:myo-inositol-1(or 4)-monophosphatase